MTVNRPAAVLVGHGSLLAASGVAMMQVAERLRTQRVTPIVEAGFLNYSRPSLADAVVKAKAQGASSVIVQPYFLIQGHYVANELPALIHVLARSHTDLPFYLGNVLGAHPALTKLAVKRLAVADPAPARTSGLLFVAHGTPIPAANAPLERVLQQVQAKQGYGSALIGYLDCNQPDILSAFDRLVAQGVTQITVLPYFLHLGRHVRQDLPALFDQARQRHACVEIRVAEHLGFDPLLAEVVAERVMENIMC